MIEIKTNIVKCSSETCIHYGGKELGMDGEPSICQCEEVYLEEVDPYGKLQCMCYEENFKED